LKSFVEASFGSFHRIDLCGLKIDLLPPRWNYSESAFVAFTKTEIRPFTIGLRLLCRLATGRRLSGGMISLHEGRGSRSKKPPARTLVLGLAVLGCTPPIWRRLVVRESMWLARLHDAIQVSFDWFDYQTHTFGLGDQRLGNPAKREGEVVEDDRDITLGELDIAKHGVMLYDYHFGEGWRVAIHVEAVMPVMKGVIYPRCMAGERAGPPEDCGGVEAYHDMLSCIKEPSTDLGREWLEWLGPTHDTERCDFDLINKSLRKFQK
jgi:hypothetical protein